MITTVLISLIIVISVLMVFIVLAQNPKGSGLSSQFGGSGATQIMGAARSGNVFEKITWGMVVAVFVLCFAVNMTLDTNTKAEGGYVSPNIEAADEKSGFTGAENNTPAAGQTQPNAGESVTPAAETTPDAKPAEDNGHGGM